MLRRIVYFAFGLALMGVAVIGARPVTGVATTAQVIIKQDLLNSTRPEMPRRPSLIGWRIGSGCTAIFSRQALDRFRSFK